MVGVQVALVVVDVEDRSVRIAVQDFAYMRADHHAQSQPSIVFKSVSHSAE